MTQPRVAVVFGGGGAKAAAQLGAAISLREAGLEPVHWVGTSMGSVVAVSMAAGADPTQLLEDFSSVKEHEILVREPMALLKGIRAPAIFKTGPFAATIDALLKTESFEELTTPCTVTAVERDTGKMVLFGTNGEDAPLIEVLTASCALPPYFAPVMVNGRLFYDGGLRQPLPLRAAEDIDCDFVIAVDVGPGFDELGTPAINPPPLIAASDTAIGWLMAGATESAIERWNCRRGLPPLVHVRPTADRGATFALDRIPEYGRAGRQAMRDALKEIG